jgi:lipoprotein-anchoring transpeptidase ErfK/SrfK
MRVPGVIAVLLALALAVPAAAEDVARASRDIPPAAPVEDEEARWWVYDRNRPLTEGLPPEVPSKGRVVTVDTTANMVYLFVDGELVIKGKAATGRDQWLRKNGREWYFRTPRGRMPVLRKIADPVWTKPDWAFVEEGKPIPPASSPLRKERGTLGRYALDLGDGIMLHGTNDPSSLGKKVSHGCIRAGDKVMAAIYRHIRVGDYVFVY